MVLRGYTMGIDRVIQEQKDKDKREKQVQNDTKNTTNVSSNQSLNTEDQSKSQNKKIPKDGNRSTIATRNPDHKKKIESVKGMLNLK